MTLHERPNLIQFQATNYGKPMMQKKRDIHWLMNTLIGMAIALVGGLYYSQLPAPAIGTMIFASSFLVIREIWMSGGEVPGPQPRNREHRKPSL